MPKTIDLTDIKIIDWTVSVILRRVAVAYEIVDDSDVVYEQGLAYFWETIPDPSTEPDGTVIPNPDNWYQLPAQYSQTLTDLTTDIRAGLLHLIGE
jgi:hypothetical protein